MSATVDALRAMHDKAKRWLTGRYKEEAARSNETWGSRTTINAVWAARPVSVQIWEVWCWTTRTVKIKMFERG